MHHSASAPLSQHERTAPRGFPTTWRPGPNVSVPKMDCARLLSAAEFTAKYIPERRNLSTRFTAKGAAVFLGVLVPSTSGAARP